MYDGRRSSPSYEPRNVDDTMTGAQQTREYHSGPVLYNTSGGDREGSPANARPRRAWTPSQPSDPHERRRSRFTPDFTARSPMSSTRGSPIAQDRPRPNHSGRYTPPRGSPSGRPGRSYVHKEDFVPHLPPEDYIQLSRENIVICDNPTPKLLVLDLNGALLHRSMASAGRNKEGRALRKSYPRPFLHNFLEYLMKSEPNGKHSPYSVLVWSSAQPHNVRHMVETVFGKWGDGIWNHPGELAKGETRLLDVWARDKMRLGNAFHSNVQTTKDLRYVLSEIPGYDERSVLLLDDSPFKATEQPWSHIVVPEYEGGEHNASKEAIARYDDGRGFEQVCTWEGMDAYLLGVIGILEAMAHQLNIPAWVRSGAIDSPEAEPADASTEVTLQTLPSAPNHRHWYSKPETYAYWVKRGIEALERKGIQLQHGLDRQPPSSPHGPSHSPVDKTKKKKSPKSHGTGANAAAMNDHNQYGIDRQIDRFRQANSPMHYQGQSSMPDWGNGGYPTYDGLLYAAHELCVSDRQRSVLFKALDVLGELGLGPGAHDGMLDPPTDVSYPLRDTSASIEPPPFQSNAESSGISKRQRRRNELARLQLRVNDGFNIAPLPVYNPAQKRTNKPSKKSKKAKKAARLNALASLPNKPDLPNVPERPNPNLPPKPKASTKLSRKARKREESRLSSTAEPNPPMPEWSPCRTKRDLDDSNEANEGAAPKRKRTAPKHAASNDEPGPAPGLALA